MKSLPLVTVIIPTYNYEKYITEAIESVLASDYPQNCIEIIVIDDGSTDNTANLVQECYNSKVKYIYIHNSKKVGAVELGLNLASGKYIFNLDADDLFETQKIKTVVDIFERDHEIVHVSHINNYWDTRTGHMELENIPSYILDKKIKGSEALTYLYSRRLAYGAGSTYAGRSDTIKGKLTFNEGIGTIVDEYLAIVTMSLGYSYFISKPLTLYRIHGDSDRNISNEDELQYISKHTVFSDCTIAIKEELLKSKVSTERFNFLYEFKSKEYKLYCRKLQSKNSLLDTLEIFTFLFKNFRKFYKDIFIVIKSYNLMKYLIPSFLFICIRRNLNTYKS